MPDQQFVAVVTGASEGIGRATALEFAAAGAAVVLVARRTQPLEEVAEQCHERGGMDLVVATDMADYEAVQDVAKQAVDSFGGIDAWVNNAAVSAFGGIAQLPLMDVRRVLDVNLMGYTYGSRIALEAMRAQRCGVIVNVSSVVGVVAQPYTHAYNMSKAAIRSLSTSLRQELWLEGQRNIHVCTILPASVDTPIFSHAANYTGRAARPIPPVYPPERVARAILGAVTRPRPEIVVGNFGRLLLGLHAIAPRMAERTMARQVESSHFQSHVPVAAGSGNLCLSPQDQPSVRGGWREETTGGRSWAAWAALGALLGTVVAVRWRRATRRNTFVHPGRGYGSPREGACPSWAPRMGRATNLPGYTPPAQVSKNCATRSSGLLRG